MQLTILFLSLAAAATAQNYGWSVAFYNSADCTGSASLNTTSGDENYFTCQPAGSGFWANGTFPAVAASADGYCHIQFFSDLACQNKLGAQVNSEFVACHAVTPAAAAYSVSCYR